MRSEVKVKAIQNGMQHSAIPRGIHAPNLGFLPQIYAPDAIILASQDHCDLKMVRDISPSKDASIHQIKFGSLP